MTAASRAQANAAVAAAQAALGQAQAALQAAQNLLADCEAAQGAVLVATLVLNRHTALT